MSQHSQVGGQDELITAQPLYTPIKRRSFFMYAGATAGATALVLAGCSKDDTNNNMPATGTVSLGSGDVGVLNYAYALEQLEAAFYAQVVKTPASDFMPNELAYFTQVAAHEAIHRDFFKAAINRDAPGKAIPGLTPNFTSITFSSRASVLGTAKAFEDLGVAAYNGAGKLIKTAAYLVIAGQIVSVEARHAAYVRDLLDSTGKSFAGDDQVDPTTGLDKAMMPTDVIAVAQTYVMEKLDASTVGK
ncbi:ferritin-like domain-containing protein [Hymenobacter coccineus]|uniref:Tat (Twin-arginine translocation) pathway signal sequence containing protein n=1 Tax=Hymenobacter coccineus TaxID=1908235 RepID=A0A1G1STA3_9BACT|nr:ferritin-like domain-containing protein [Hymenobacter coccineus]OGX81845.1 Tat (twin-arginine translocation) pathway signal sequence containing protein [Hymenobacter coccineus]